MAEKVVEKKRKREEHEEPNLDRPPLAEKKESGNLFQTASDVYNDELNDKRKPMILLSILDCDEDADKADMLKTILIPQRVCDVMVGEANKTLGYYLKERALGWEILPVPHESTPAEAEEWKNKNLEKRKEIQRVDDISNEFAYAVLDHISSGKIKGAMSYKENLLPILEESITIEPYTEFGSINNLKIVRAYQIVLSY
jgi:hypothetical protein